MEKVINCPCGFVLRGKNDDEVVQKAQEHAKSVHGMVLSQVAAGLYPDNRLDGTGLIAGEGWIPNAPVDLADVTLTELPDAPEPVLDGTEREAARSLPDSTGR